MSKNKKQAEVIVNGNEEVLSAQTVGQSLVDFAKTFGREFSYLEDSKCRIELAYVIPQAKYAEGYNSAQLHICRIGVDNFQAHIVASKIGKGELEGFVLPVGAEYDTADGKYRFTLKANYGQENATEFTFDSTSLL